MAGFFVFGGSDSSDADAGPPLAGEVAAQDVEEPASPGAVGELDPQLAVVDEPAATVVDEPAATVAAQPPATEPVAAVVSDVAASAFPARWDFTATKTATIVPAPDFISATPIGAMLAWSVAVTESCNGDDCTYTSVIRPLIPESVIGEVPEATWVVNGAEWPLDVTWLSTQSSFGDGTGSWCVRVTCVCGGGQFCVPERRVAWRASTGALAPPDVDSVRRSGGAARVGHLWGSRRSGAG